MRAFEFPQTKLMLVYNIHPSSPTSAPTVLTGQSLLNNNSRACLGSAGLCSSAFRAISGLRITLSLPSHLSTHRNRLRLQHLEVSHRKDATFSALPHCHVPAITSSRSQHACGYPLLRLCLQSLVYTARLGNSATWQLDSPVIYSKLW